MSTAGIASVVVPIYVAEASPVHQRGRLTLMWQILINFGVMVSSIIAGSFSYVHENGWRYVTLQGKAREKTCFDDLT